MIFQYVLLIIVYFYNSNMHDLFYFQYDGKEKAQQFDSHEYQSEKK